MSSFPAFNHYALTVSNLQRSIEWYERLFESAPTAVIDDAVASVVHPSGSPRPKGETLHAAGASEGGWTVISIYDSKADLEGFRDGTLLPAMQEVIEGGFAVPPQESGFETHVLIP
jgi:glyoxalase/bleomycin resistance protein/dioxygenase superfamily protein